MKKDIETRQVVKIPGLKQPKEYDILAQTLYFTFQRYKPEYVKKAIHYACSQLGVEAANDKQAEPWLELAERNG